jgi:hypothetical protein
MRGHHLSVWHTTDAPEPVRFAAAELSRYVRLGGGPLGGRAGCPPAAALSRSAPTTRCPFRYVIRRPQPIPSLLTESHSHRLV